jgi:hypothetical protein
MFKGLFPMLLIELYMVIVIVIVMEETQLKYINNQVSKSGLI